MQVILPDGTEVRASAITAREADDGWRDFGLYCDKAWDADWPSDTIDWPDFGVPSDGSTAARQILRAFDRARDGQRVEVGCLGGLGRTGTVLACMAIAAGVPADEAVGWVRMHYRPDAIETPDQEAWVIWFAAWMQNAKG